MSTLRTSIALSAAAATTLLATACTNELGGQAGPSSTLVSATPDASSSPSPSSSANPFSAMNPCETLNKAVADQGGFPPATPTIADTQRTCASHKPREGDNEGVDVALSLQEGQKISENINNPNKASAGTVNDRAATEEREPLNSTGQCSIKIEVKPNSRALLIVTYSSDTEKACKFAEAIAEKVEPLLPKNS